MNGFYVILRNECSTKNTLTLDKKIDWWR